MGFIERDYEDDLRFHELDMNNKFICWRRLPGEPDSGDTFDLVDLFADPPEIVPRPNETIFNYLADWDPDALLYFRDEFGRDYDGLWALQVAMKYCDKGKMDNWINCELRSARNYIVAHPIGDTFQMILKA